MILKSFVLFAVFTGSLCLKIEDISVPSVVIEERDSSVLLNCKFNLMNEDPKGLMVKWFFPNRTNLVYQWIPGIKPSAVHAFKKKVNLTDEDEVEFRGIRLLNPDVSLTGEHTCIVSTHGDIKSASKNMTVISLGKEPPHLRYMTDPDNPDLVRFDCSVNEVYPVPDLAIYSNEVKFQNQSTVSTTWYSHFNVTASVAVPSENLAEGQEIVCKLKNPLIQDFKQSSLTYTPGAYGDTMPTAQLAVGSGHSPRDGAAAALQMSAFLVLLLGGFNIVLQSHLSI